MYIEDIKSIFLYNPDNPLLFTGLYFWMFFFFVLAVFALIHKKIRLRNTFLLIMSLFFYYKTGGYFVFILIFLTCIDYTLGFKISKTENLIRRRFYLFLSLFSNLSTLIYFKYTFFFTSLLNDLFNTNIKAVDILSLLSNNLTGSHFDINNIILPVGVSFFTFQTISYTFDVYRRNVEPVKNIIDYGFFVSFFPQLVAGPIVRAATFIPQMSQPFRLEKYEFGAALFLILNGLVKKILISDFISINFVDRVFDNPHLYSGFENLAALYGYAIQIYCDFSGYTDIAIGCALLLGFRLNINFNSPYKATNITDFWHRWHISLSTWLRDYLYISLGGNRKGKVRTYINLFITMLLGGLWHGASVKFIIWGALHGAGLAFHKFWRLLPFVVKNKDKNNSNFLKPFYLFISAMLTFHFVLFGWLLFRAKDMQTVSFMLKNIFNKFNATLVPDIIYSYKNVFIIMLIGFIVHWLPVKVKTFYKELFIRMPAFIKILIIILTIFILYQVKSSNIQPFIYFQF
ncbi:MAG: MBOAT family protein [Bacteroidales bacterium]|nr:MBOAT family protein [Bacteroidales bacterium]